MRLLAKFDAIVDAMSAAVAIQNELKARNLDISDDRKVQFRIGVNLGDVIEERGDIYGDGVNIAARLEGLADPGGICMSEAVHSAVTKQLGLKYVDMGEQTVKNISEPIHVYKVSLREEPSSGAIGDISLELSDKPSIAVLPFANMSGDSEQEYLADGITEDILTGLSRARWLVVTSRNSSFVYKGKSTDVKRIAEELGVRYILEGSVRMSGVRARVTAQLIDAPSDPAYLG